MSQISLKLYICIYISTDVVRPLIFINFDVVDGFVLFKTWIRVHASNFVETWNSQKFKMMKVADILSMMEWRNVYSSYKLVQLEQEVVNKTVNKRFGYLSSSSDARAKEEKVIGLGIRRAKFRTPTFQPKHVSDLHLLDSSPAITFLFPKWRISRSQLLVFTAEGVKTTSINRENKA